jgi:thymidylate synthase
MNKLDKDYISLVNDILENGHSKGDRTGTGTKSVFGRQIRHKMSDGFPLLTTKKMPWKVMVTELVWFLRGDTNIKFLVDNGCNIWNGDAYKNYINNPDYKAKSVAHLFGSQAGQLVECPTQEDFINKIKTDDEFAEKWGELGPIYGKQWRSWGGYKKTGTEGWLQKRNSVWYVKWSDLQSFAEGIHWNETKLCEADQLSLEDSMIGEKIYFDFNTTGYDEFNFSAFREAQIINPDEIAYSGGVDQIQNVLNELRTNPDSRRLIVSAWNVGEMDKMVLPPCHNFFQFYTRELSTEEMCVLANVDYRKSTEWTYHGKNIDSDLEIRTMLSDKDLKNIPTRAISLMWNQRSVNDKSAA